MPPSSPKPRPVSLPHLGYLLMAAKLIQHVFRLDGMPVALPSRLRPSHRRIRAARALCSLPQLPNSASCRLTLHASSRAPHPILRVCRIIVRLRCLPLSTTQDTVKRSSSQHACCLSASDPLFQRSPYARTFATFAAQRTQQILQRADAPVTQHRLCHDDVGWRDNHPLEGAFDGHRHLPVSGSSYSIIAFICSIKLEIS